jgi:hypothetical protein
LSVGEIFRVVTAASNFVAIVPGIIAILTFNRHSRTQRYLAILVWGEALVGLCGSFFNHILQRPNIWLIPFYVILNFVMFTLIFRHYINQRLIPYLIAGFVIFGLTYGIVTNFYAFGEPIRIVEAGGILIYCGLYFRTTLRQLDKENLTQDPIFWISAGAFIYYSASFLFFVTIGLFVGLVEINKLVWGVNASFAILLHVFFFVIAFLKRPRTA